MADEAEVVVDKEYDEFEAAFNKEAAEREGSQDDEAIDTEIDNHTGAGIVDDLAVTDLNTDKPAKVDEFEGWSDTQKEKYNSVITQRDGLQHRIDSDDGRVRAFQVKVNNLEHDIAEIQKKPGQPSTEEIAAAMGDEESWANLEEDYPEIAGAINKRFEAQQAQVDTALAPVIKKQQNDAAVQAETAQTESYDEVAKTFPTWQDAVKTKDFTDWMDSQPPGIQSLASSDDTRDASSLINLYDDHRVDSGQKSLRADPIPDDGSSVDTKANEVARRRERQLEDGTALPSRSARIVTDDETGEDEFERSFNAFAKRKAAANRA